MLIQEKNGHFPLFFSHVRTHIKQNYEKFVIFQTFRAQYLLKIKVIPSYSTQPNFEVCGVSGSQTFPKVSLNQLSTLLSPFLQLLKCCLFPELEHDNGTATTMKQKYTQHTRIRSVSTTYKEEGFWSFIFKNKTNKETSKVSLCSPGYPGSHHKDQGCPELFHPPLPHPARINSVDYNTQLDGSQILILLLGAYNFCA